jgi:hypothetical protein
MMTKNMIDFEDNIDFLINMFGWIPTRLYDHIIRELIRNQEPGTRNQMVRLETGNMVLGSQFLVLGVNKLEL